MDNQEEGKDESDQKISEMQSTNRDHVLKQTAVNLPQNVPSKLISQGSERIIVEKQDTAQMPIRGKRKGLNSASKTANSKSMPQRPSQSNESENAKIGSLTSEEKIINNTEANNDSNCLTLVSNRVEGKVSSVSLNKTRDSSIVTKPSCASKKSRNCPARVSSKTNKTDSGTNRVTFQQQKSETHSALTTTNTEDGVKVTEYPLTPEASEFEDMPGSSITLSEKEVITKRVHSDQSSNKQKVSSNVSSLSLKQNNIHSERETQIDEEQDTFIGLQCLPDQLLDAVLRWLSFADVSRVGGVCRSFRRAAAALLRREMRSLVARVEAMMGALEAETTSQAQGGACMVPVVMRVILHTVLRVLLGEARVLRAVCWRYVRMDDQPSSVTKGPWALGGRVRDLGSSPVVCFPGGDLLDEFERLLEMVSVDNFSNDLDPEVVTALFMRMERFLDHFEGSVEPLLRCGETPFGVKVLDLLGACDTADCALSVTHGTSDHPFLVTVNFELRDASAVDSPPPFDGQMPSRMRLRLLARYLRNNVRWVNFFRPMRELWDLQDEIENRWAPSTTGEHRDISRHHVLHQVVLDAVKAKVFRRSVCMPPPRPSPSHLPRKQQRQREMYEQVVLRAEPPLWRETFSRRINPAVRSLRLGLGCNMELSGADKSLLPLDLEFLDEERVDFATRHPGLSPQTSCVANVPNEAFASRLNSGPLQVSGGTTAESRPALPAQLPLPPPPLAHGEASPDWGPWLRLRRNYHATDAQDGVPADGWDDYGSDLRGGGGEYGFRGEVRVTFPPRALSSIVTETVIQVHDTMTDTNITSDRRNLLLVESTAKNDIILFSLLLDIPLIYIQLDTSVYFHTTEIVITEKNKGYYVKDTLRQILEQTSTIRSDGSSTYNFEEDDSD